MTTSEKELLVEIKELRQIMDKLFGEVRGLRQLLEDREDALLTPEEMQIVDETRQALSEGKKDRFLKLDDL